LIYQILLKIALLYFILKVKNLQHKASTVVSLFSLTLMVLNMVETDHFQMQLLLPKNQFFIDRLMLLGFRLL